MTKTISLLGSTGSIGRQTLQVARELGLSVAALTANRQVDLLEQQAREFHPSWRCCMTGTPPVSCACGCRIRISRWRRGRRVCCWRPSCPRPTPWSPPLWAAWAWSPPWPPSGKKTHCPGQ